MEQRWPALWALSGAQWARFPQDWVGASGSEERRLVSLAWHLLEWYPVPRFMDQALLTSPLCPQAVPLFEWLGRGGSVRRAVREGLLPRTLTRRMCHELTATPDGWSLVPAIRRAQLRALGGGPGLISTRSTIPGTKTRSKSRPRASSTVVTHSCPVGVLRESEGRSASRL